MKSKAKVAVFGGAAPGNDMLQIAYQVGKLLAKADVVLYCGGLGGVMEMAAKGASDAGGTTVGILPTPGISAANPYIKIPVATNMGHARNIILAHSVDGAIAIDGEYGTLSEISIALKIGIPVVAIKPPVKVPGIIEVASPLQAVQALLDKIGYST